MSKSLVIVESPAKARTINKYLGRGFTVKASMGHVRDLPKTRLGIDVENGFQPRYQVIPDKRKIVKELSGAAKKADTVYLAPDPDREGEAIAWHLAKALKLPESKVKRVTFNEITKRAVQKAFERPGELNLKLVDAQQARRILDRLMGYLLSPLLWEKISRGLSAGRVQSVAARLIVEREREIEAFVPQEFWKILVALETPRGERFEAGLHKVDGKKETIPNEERARELVQRIEGSSPRVVRVEEKPKTLAAPPPFITSTLQQAASTKLRFSAKRTMRLAQDMYEGVNLGGESVALITYMRTDSFHVAGEALEAVRSLIGERFGADDLPEKPNRFRAKKGAQEAHEAIRPTDVFKVPGELETLAVPGGKGTPSHTFTSAHWKLYKLIWERFVASQMKPAKFQLTIVSVDAAGCELRAEGKRLVDPGFLKVAGRDPDEVLLPEVREEEDLKIQEVTPSQHFTQPPNRYTEATLVRALEKKGIGRPSTYAAIISTIQDRGYVELKDRKFFATELGKLVTDQLVAHFGDVVNVDFTSRMEDLLDQIEDGKADWVKVVSEFHKTFEKDLEKARKEMKDFRKNPEVTDEKCEKCGAPLVIRRTRKGTFLGCSKYPECRFTKPMPGSERPAPVETEHTCPECGSKLLLREGKNGKFLGCSGYPECKYTVPVDAEGNPAPPKETGEMCEKCGAPMVIKQGRRGPFLACSAYPKCKNARPIKGAKRPEPKPTDEKCDKCGAPMVIRQGRWGPFLACSAYPKCKNIRKIPKEKKEPVQAEDSRDPKTRDSKTEDPKT